LAELDGCALGDFEIDVALQMNRAGEIRAGRDDDFAAAGFRALIDGGAKRGSAIGAAVRFGVEMKSAIWEARRFDARADRRKDGLPRIG